MPTTEEIRRQALALSPLERELLADELIASLSVEPGYQAAWDADIARRMQLMESGAAELIEWDEAMQDIFGEPSSG